MLEFICYLTALVLGLLAALTGPPFPPMDRVRLLAAAFVASLVPALVHAAQAV